MDLRFPTYYLNDRRIRRMTADEFRFFVLATAWSVSNMTDGRIDGEDLYLIPFADEDLPDALVKLGVWTVTDGGWNIADFEKTQTSAAKLEAAFKNRLKADAERQKNKYDKDKAKAGAEAEAESTSTNQTSREAHVRFERKRKGKAEAEASAEALHEESYSTGSTPTESSDYPTDEKAVQYRQYIEGKGLRSPADLVKDQPKVDMRYAKEIWAQAYPSSSGRAA